MLKNKNAIIVGARTGIGLETLKLFAEQNANIYACTREPNKEFELICQELKKKYNSNISLIFFDVNDVSESKSKINGLISKIDKIDIYVNTVAEIDFSLFEMTTLSFAKKIFETNFFSNINLMQLIIKKMKKTKNGSIINLSSSSSLENNIGSSIYASSKSALETISKVISREVGRYNIRVNVVQPGLVETKSMRKKHTDELINQYISKISLKNIANTRDIANLILFLASDNSSHITGQVIKINGGI
tara:strand:- start:76 stop:816 length:741 start_codon:yes stop_codon:yes gene_type:complete